MPQNVVMSYHFATLQPSLSNCCLPGTWSRCANKWCGDTVCNEIHFGRSFRAVPSQEALAKFIINWLVVGGQSFDTFTHYTEIHTVWKICI